MDFNNNGFNAEFRNLPNENIDGVIYSLISQDTNNTNIKNVICNIGTVEGEELGLLAKIHMGIPLPPQPTTATAPAAVAVAPVAAPKGVTKSDVAQGILVFYKGDYIIYINGSRKRNE